MCILDLFRLQMVVRVRKKKEGYYRRNKILSTNAIATTNPNNKYNPNKHPGTTTSTANLSTIDKMKKKKENKKNGNKQKAKMNSNCLKCRRQRSSSMSTTACLNPACDADTSDFCCGSTRAASSPWGSVKTLSTQFTEGATSICLCPSDEDEDKKNLDHLSLFSPEGGDDTNRKNNKNKNKGNKNIHHQQQADFGTLVSSKGSGRGSRSGHLTCAQGFEGIGCCGGKDNLGFLGDEGFGLECGGSINRCSFLNRYRSRLKEEELTQKKEDNKEKEKEARMNAKNAKKSGGSGSNTLNNKNKTKKKKQKKEEVDGGGAAIITSAKGPSKMPDPDRYVGYRRCMTGVHTCTRIKG